MVLPPVQERQIRPCSVCAFFVFISEFQEGRCNLGKGEQNSGDTTSVRWEIEDPSELYGWSCIYNISPEEIEESVDPWVKSIYNESMRFFHSAHNRRDVVSNRRTKKRRL